MSPSSWQDWIAWAGLVLPLATLAWAALIYVANQRTIRRRLDFERFMELIARYNNAKGDEPLFTQMAAAFELRNYPRYRGVIWNIWRFENEKVALLDDVSNDPIRAAKRQLVQAELRRTLDFLNRSIFGRLCEKIDLPS